MTHRDNQPPKVDHRMPASDSAARERPTKSTLPTQEQSTEGGTPKRAFGKTKVTGADVQKRVHGRPWVPMDEVAPKYAKLLSRMNKFELARAAGVPVRYKKLHQRAVLGLLGSKTLIKMQCLECIGYEPAEITKCTARLCHLWTARPYQEKAP